MKPKSYTGPCRLTPDEIDSICSKERGIPQAHEMARIIEHVDALEEDLKAATERALAAERDLTEKLPAAVETIRQLVVRETEKLRAEKDAALLQIDTLLKVLENVRFAVETIDDSKRGPATIKQEGLRQIDAVLHLQKVT